MRLRHPLALAMAFLAVLAALASATDELEIAIAIPKNGAGERVVGFMSDTKSQFRVVLTNISDQPQRIWTGGSWGYYALSFEISDSDGKRWRAQKKLRPWRRNSPVFGTIEPHDQMVIEVAPADAEIWEGFPHPAGQSQTFKMRAIFEIKPDGESKEHGVWTGRVVSKIDDYTFEK